MNKVISAFLSERIAENDFPSAVYLVAEKGEIVFRDALGYAVVEPERIEARLDTIYDLASLTKPLVTGLLSAIFVDEARIVLDQPVRTILSQFTVGQKSEITFLDLLTHTSGLEAWVPLYLILTTENENFSGLIGAFADFEPISALRSSVTYSDLNFIILFYILEMFDHTTLSIMAERRIFERVGLAKTMFNPAIQLKDQVAATEKGNEYEKQTCIEQGYLKPPATAGGSDLFRDYQIWGEVHDGNAWFMGGVAGHAGLFSTAEEVFKIALQFLPNHTKLLKPETCELFCTNFTKGMNEDRSFAFQLASTEGSTAGTKMSPESFGHNGFTGTSLWIDPVKDRIFVLLTNRTHNHPLPFVNINSVRRRFHDLAVEQLEGR